MAFIVLPGLLNAQTPTADTADREVTKERTKKAWEIGIGTTILQFSRVDLTYLNTTTEEYNMGLQMRHNVIGGKPLYGT